MAGPSELKRLWRKCKEYRSAKKQRSSQASSESSSRDSKGSLELEETTSMIVGLGLDIKQEEYIELTLDDDDPRFRNNPHGIGCSRTYEVPYNGVTSSVSTSPASMRPLVPRENKINGSGELLSRFKLGAVRPESIDMVKGKRKGRMPGNRADDRHKFLLDGPSSRAKPSVKSFRLVRQRAWTG